VVREEFSRILRKEPSVVTTSESPDSRRSRSTEWPWKRETERADLFRRDELETPPEPPANFFARLWVSVKTFLGFDEK
jgi:hypothetical protein